MGTMTLRLTLDVTIDPARVPPSEIVEYIKATAEKFPTQQEVVETKYKVEAVINMS